MVQYTEKTYTRSINYGHSHVFLYIFAHSIVYVIAVTYHIACCVYLPKRYLHIHIFFCRNIFCLKCDRYFHLALFSRHFDFICESFPLNSSVFSANRVAIFLKRYELDVFIVFPKVVVLFIRNVGWSKSLRTKYDIGKSLFVFRQYVKGTRRPTLLGPLCRTRLCLSPILSFSPVPETCFL